MTIRQFEARGPNGSSACISHRTVPRYGYLVLAGLPGHRHRSPGPRPRRAATRPPRNRRARKPAAVRRLLRLRPGLRRLGLVRLRPHQRGGVLHRLPGRTVAIDGQRVRHGDDLQFLRHPPPLPAPGAVLGHPRRHRPAGDHDRPGRRAGEGIRLDHVRVRRLPAVQRREDAVQQARGRTRPRAQPGAALPAQAHAGDQGTARASLLRPPAGRQRQAGALRHPAVLRPGADRAGRPGVRGGQRAGDLRHHPGPVHRLHLEHLRHPRPARPVLLAGGDDPPLRLPEIRPGPGAGVHRYEDHAPRCDRQDSRRPLAWRNLRPAGGRHPALPAEDPHAESHRRGQGRTECRTRSGSNVWTPSGGSASARAGSASATSGRPASSPPCCTAVARGSWNATPRKKGRSPRNEKGPHPRAFPVYHSRQRLLRSISLGTYLPSSNLPIAARCTSSGPSARRRVRCMAYQ